jgi:hypothetical protein
LPNTTTTACIVAFLGLQDFLHHTVFRHERPPEYLVPPSCRKQKNDLRNKSRGPDDTAPAKTCVFLVSPISGHGDDEYRFLPSKNHHRDAKHMAEKMFFFFSFFLSYLNVSNPEFGIDSSGFIPIY